MPITLRDQADWVMKPALLAVPGVAHVIVFGGAVRQIQIQPDLPRMTSYGFTLTDLADAARPALALHGAGFIDLAHQRVLIQTPVPTPDPVGDRQCGAGRALGQPHHHRRCRHRDRSAGAAIRRCADHGTAGHTAVAGQPVWRQHPGDHPRGGSGAGATDAGARRRKGITVYPALHRPANFIEQAPGHRWNNRW